MQVKHVLWLLSLLFVLPFSLQAQSFDETWEEFLDNDKVVNMSALGRPDKRFDLANYAKFLLMKTTVNFCQSDIEVAETMMAEITSIDPKAVDTIPGYVDRQKFLAAKIEAYHGIEALWQRFLVQRDVTVEELEAVYPPSSICEKQTLAKYSYMTAHHYLCEGTYEKSKKTFESRTLKIAEMTSLDIGDVEGLAKEVGKMKRYFQLAPKLDAAWNTYVKTGVSPGFDEKLPVFDCYPIPNIKALVLNASRDLCSDGPAALEEIDALKAASGGELDRSFERQLKPFKMAVAKNNAGRTTLDRAWADFVPDNEISVKDYEYEYCEIEPLIKAHIMDGFIFVCITAEENLKIIDSLENLMIEPLDPVAVEKIEELKTLQQDYSFNESKISMIWENFIAAGDKLDEPYLSTDQFCDNVTKVKHWTMQGLMSDCKEAVNYLDQIEAFNEKFDFVFYEELECRIQKLRIKVWDCRYNALVDIANIDGAEGNSEERLQDLLIEFGMDGERPGPCEEE